MTRFGWLAAALASLGAGASAVFHPSPRLIWNASASVPIGLYAVQPVGTLRVADLVVVQPPAALSAFLDARHYLPKGVPMLKRVLGLPGQAVCRVGRTITVDGITEGEALDRDSRGRPLPNWSGCRVIANDEVFLMNLRSRDSFDGRYFGPLSAAAIIGRADALWTRAEP